MRNIKVDYMNTLEKCAKCDMPIIYKTFRPIEKPLDPLKSYHPLCFTCLECTKSLDGIDFTLDKEEKAYCIRCYYEKFSHTCATCQKNIVPKENETEVDRVVFMDRSYHVECYKCEDCSLELNSQIEGRVCYPLEEHLFCKTCNLNRLKAMKTK
uniref:LIM zinc-binding domain-containing protein n=1 Tax=Acrobeloides nanus TaxID=290746 RepID=A0A914EGW6_9BILA